MITFLMCYSDSQNSRKLVHTNHEVYTVSLSQRETSSDENLRTLFILINCFSDASILNVGIPTAYISMVWVPIVLKFSTS